MFNKLALDDPFSSRSGTTAPGFGSIVEAMLFYGHVEVIAQWNTVEGLLDVCKPEGLRHMLDRGSLGLTYQENWPFVVSTVDPGSGTTLHCVAAVDLGDKRWRAEKSDVGNVIEAACISRGMKRGRSRRIAASLTARTRVCRVGPQTVAASLGDFQDTAYMLFTAREFIKSVAPAYMLPEPLVFEVVPSPIAMLHFNESQSKTLTVRTNIDFAAASKVRAHASATALSPSDVLSQIVLVRAKLDQAATLGMELATSPLHSSMISRRVNNVLVRARHKSEGEIESFSEIILHNGMAVREAVNAGARSFAEIVELLDRAEPFKRWLRDQPHTEQLIGAYVRDATAGTWAEKLPKKAFRWATFLGIGQVVDHAGLGGLGTATAFAVSAFDGFVLDRLIAGWNPSQFVDGPLRDFVAR